jgi:hypothetical protein
MDIPCGGDDDNTEESAGTAESGAKEQPNSKAFADEDVTDHNENSKE